MLAKRVFYYIKSIFHVQEYGNHFEKPLYHFYGDTIKYQCEVCSASNENTYLLNKKNQFKCKFCGHKLKIDYGRLTGFFRKLKRFKVVYFTKSTAIELEALKKGNPENIFIRSNLKYHTHFDCRFAHKDYTDKDGLVVYNSGVIKSINDSRLSICTSCIGEEFELCSRCGGVGYFKQYRHIENGVCFKCRGVGLQ